MRPSRRLRFIRSAGKDYDRRRALYDRFAIRLTSLLEEAVLKAGIKIHTINKRTKTLDSFVKDLKKESRSARSKGELERALSRLTDQAGLRVITYLPTDIEKVGGVIEKEFNVIKKVDVGGDNPSFLGYRSVHFDVSLRDSRTRLLEYRVFKGLRAEIQVRTILQHAWAEIEHDIVYKSRKRPPKGAVHRFATLSGLLEVEDREFQSIHDAS